MPAFGKHHFGSLPEHFSGFRIRVRAERQEKVQNKFYRKKFK
jgi:hypothetical protein